MLTKTINQRVPKGSTRFGTDIIIHNTGDVPVIEYHGFKYRVGFHQISLKLTNFFINKIKSL